MVYGSMDAAESEQTIRGAIERGVQLIDTADAYEGGLSEEVVGRAVRDHRASLCVATKFGIRGRRGDGSLIIDGRPAYVREACEQSLRRLGVDTIDLYYLHRVDPDVPIEDTVGAMAELVRKGWVRHLGLSEVNAEKLKRAHEVHPIAALQSEYSLWSRSVEAEVLGTCRQLGIALVAYSPLGRGFLAGAVKNAGSLALGDIRRAMGERFASDALAHNSIWLSRLEELARSGGISVAQLALGWLLQAGDDIVPIPGTRRIAKLEENLGALQVAWPREKWRQVEAIVEAGQVKGARLPAPLLRQLGS
jgi:aryl-alcohol dehydrogenase-like predicted oxidoreductase